MRQKAFQLLLVASLAFPVAPAMATPSWRPAAGDQGATQDPSSVDPIERLRAQLQEAGPEGAAAREVAIDRLLALPDERAHAVLRARLALADDPDQVRAAVLVALARRLPNPADEVFGARAHGTALHDKLVRGYVQALAVFWSGELADDDRLPADPLRDLARLCLVRLPARPASEGLRQLAAAADAPAALRSGALLAAGDAQNLLFGRLLADFVADASLHRAARAAFANLTFVEAPPTRREEALAWLQQHGERRYLELAESAARQGAMRARQLRSESLLERRRAAAELVRARTERRIGIDWPVVQTQVLVDDEGTVTLCLEQLQATLADAVLADDAAARHAFARALLQRYRTTAAPPSRALLLEVAAYLCRTGEAELATEIAQELRDQLVSADEGLHLAALRGLRRHPSPEARAAVVAFARAAAIANRDRALAAALQTLATTGEPPWRAPIETAPDRDQWLDLLRAVLRGPLPRERRAEAMAVALLTDREGKRVPEVFDLLLEIATDQAAETDQRTACLVHMQSFRELPGRSELLVETCTNLLADPERDVRLFVADALTRLPEAAEEVKRAWIARIVAALREQLGQETNAAVVRAMLDCLVACSRAPGVPGASIGALNVVLESVPVPAPPEQSQRVDALLRTLTTIAADPRADQGQWIGACEMLWRHERRRLLRLVLESHNAVLLAKEVRNAEASTAQRARSALRFLLLAAVLKGPREPWQSTPELRTEANDVRIAFEALPPQERLPENLQDPPLRLLRLDVLVACGKTQDAVALGRAWLDEKEPKDNVPLGKDQQDAVRYLVAEALLQDGKLDDAAAMMLGAAAPAGETRAVELAERLGSAFAAAEPRKATEWLEKAVKATPEGDAALPGRLVAWWQARVQVRPAERELVRAEIEQRAALFESAECPAALKAAVAALRGP